MKFQKLMHIGLLAGVMFTASAAVAQAQTYNGNGYNNEPRAEYGRDGRGDFRRREALERRVEADRRAVEHERRELNRSGWYNAGHERRELSAAERRLERDTAELRALDGRYNRGPYNGYR
jgi:hypothetical protein